MLRSVVGCDRRRLGLNDSPTAKRFERTAGGIACRSASYPFGQRWNACRARRRYGEDLEGEDALAAAARAGERERATGLRGGRGGGGGRGHRGVSDQPRRRVGRERTCRPG